MKNNDNLANLIQGINHISLNQEDLMEAVLGFAMVYLKGNVKHESIIDEFFLHPIFVDQSLMAAREGIVLAMNAITLDEVLNFKEVVDGCVNLENQRYVENTVCADSETKEIMKQFLAGLRRELFSRLYSQNKEFEKFSKIPKGVLVHRYNQFMAEKF